MKTFEDLFFKPHPNGGFKTLAQMDFENTYGVSVTTGEDAYTDECNPYEVAVIKDDALCYTTHITDDVIGYCDSKKVTEIMKQIQSL